MNLTPEKEAHAWRVLVSADDLKSLRYQAEFMVANAGRNGWWEKLADALKELEQRREQENMG